jgi:dihydrofolate synthase/folylpolyglutamate synthase
MNYNEALDWLFQQFPSYQIKGAEAYKPDLSNALRLCDVLDIDISALKYIHVAGTNGKGSTTSMLASILTESGELVGLFTSPHIIDFRERIRVNGTMISESDVLSFCKEIQHLSLGFSPSFFEITWALALKHFIRQGCTICVIETGLGGRLDSTNVITPLISVITNVGLDHVAILGSTLEKIAFEKAGIIKVNVPVVIGERQPEIEDVFLRKSQSSKTRFVYASDIISDEQLVQQVTYLRKNERTVRATIEVLNQQNVVSISNKTIDRGLKNLSLNTGFVGRFSIIQENPRIILDVAHNADGFSELLKSLNSLTYDKLHVILGMSSDKDLSASIGCFPDGTSLYFCEFSNPRSMKVGQLKALFEKLPHEKYFFSNLKDIFVDLQSSVNKEDIILVAGSFFLLSDFFYFFPEKHLSI